MSTSVSALDFPAIRWHGHWIWLPEEPITPSGFWAAQVAEPRPQTHGLFRKRLHLETVPERVPARITADSRYILFANGREVARGPVRSQPRRMHYDMVDLAPFLQPGENVLALLVVYYGASTSFWMPAAPNNTLGATGVLVFEADLGAAGWLVSDASWRAHKASAWSNDGRDGTNHGGGIPVESFDARRFPANWQAADFDDSGWGAAQVVRAMHIGGHARSQPPTDPYGPLYPRSIAALGGALVAPVAVQRETLAEPAQPLPGGPIARVQAAVGLRVHTYGPEAALPATFTLRDGEMARLSFDMGRIVSGLVGFTVQAPAGTLLDFSYTEVPMRASASMDQMFAGTRYIARGHNDTFEVFDSNGFRYAYLLISGAQGPVTVSQFTLREHLYPWQGAACFACSDEELNRIFHAGVRTVALCSHDAFIDCATREQRTWVGDSVVHQMVHFTTNTDWRLNAHNLVIGNSPRADGLLPMVVVCDIEASGNYSLPDWSLHWIHGLYNQYRFTGDQGTIAALLPTAERILRWFQPYQAPHGVLKDTPEWTLIDWSSVSTADESATLTALWARGLHEFATMAAWLGDQWRATWAETLYERVRVGFEQFWDARRGSYVDHVVDGEQCPEMSQLAGALAVVSGLAPEARWQQIIATITDPARLVVRSWLGDGAGGQSMEKWQQQAREGRYDITWDVEREIVLAEPFMSYVVHDAVAQAGEAERLPAMYRRWSQFLADGYDTLGERWDFGTRAHGWSSTPTRDMVLYTLGVTPAAPGYSEARIAPAPGGLEWVTGSVPTPHGLIHVTIQPETLLIESPIPVTLELTGQPPRRLPAGMHILQRY